MWKKTGLKFVVGMRDSVLLWAELETNGADYRLTDL
jgi:hypothetical protein